MAYVAQDGKRFAHSQQGRRYDDWLSTTAGKGKRDTEEAPGGPGYDHTVKAHGLARKVVIEREGNGRTRVTSFHGDGHRFTEVHPETYRAHDVGRELLGIEPPPALQTHGRARSQPTGPKENERIRREDSRVEDEDQEQ